MNSSQGQLHRDLCTHILSLINQFHDDRELTKEERTTLVSGLTQMIHLLNANAVIYGSEVIRWASELRKLIDDGDTPEQTLYECAFHTLRHLWRCLGLPATPQLNSRGEPIDWADVALLLIDSRPLLPLPCYDTEDGAAPNFWAPLTCTRAGFNPRTRLPWHPLVPLAEGGEVIQPDPHLPSAA